MSLANRSHEPRRPAAKAVCSAAALLATLALASTAHAQNQIAVDVEAAWADDPEDDSGFGVGVRAGHVWDIAVLELTPEFGASYHDFDGAPNASAWNLMAGGRFGIDLLIQPSVYAHAGVGHFGYDLPTREVSHTSLAYDVGVALDLTLLPVIDIGAHATVAGIAGGENVDPFSWLAIGGHIAFSFGED
jgi:opacity protein-like surface antigen